MYEAEAYAPTHGFEIALRSPIMAQHAPAIHIILDNLSVAKNAALGTGLANLLLSYFAIWLAKEEKTITVQGMRASGGMK